ncbi:MAG: CRISPR system precrRNA processing endoribonuclease RAMP protein Cas6 [Armatimonadetes bacterium]|nr:CRISPR system precrRNA processing endoribonuclease RAMP protein Cas6 [Armatimonadota bacterium]
MSCPREFSCTRHEIVLAAGEQGLLLPPYKGSTLRGGFARVFQRLVCARRSESCRECLLKESCPYHLVFETSPPAQTKALRKYASIPRPFVLEPPLEEKTAYAPGETLSFQLILMGKTSRLLPYFIVTLEELGRLGMGKGRRPFRVREIAALGLNGERRTIYRGTEKVVRAEELIIRGQDIWDLCAAGSPGEKITLEFLTPARLTFQGNLADRPEFHILIRNLLRRVSSLLYFYHGCEWQADFAGIIRKAEEIKLNANGTRWLDWERYSSRHDTKMKLGGLVGKATYRGPLADFRPLLKLGELVHAGKGAVFGLGKYVERESHH